MSISCFYLHLHVNNNIPLVESHKPFQKNLVSGCAFAAVWILKPFNIKDNLANFILSASFSVLASSSLFLSQNNDSATLPLQPTLWLKMGLHLLWSLVQLVPNRHCTCREINKVRQTDRDTADNLYLRGRLLSGWELVKGQKYLT